MTNDKLQIKNRGTGLRIAAKVSRLAIAAVLALVLVTAVVPGAALADNSSETPRYDSGNIPLTPEERSNYRIVALVGSLVIALAVPGIIVGVWTSQLKSVRKKDFACDYVRPGSMALNVQRDIFLYRNISRTRRAENSSGGSGSFRSSSGRSRRF